MLQAVEHILEKAVMMPALNLLELTYHDVDRVDDLYCLMECSCLDGDYGGDSRFRNRQRMQTDLETRSHHDFLKHTEAAVCKWRGSMDWNVLEQKQICSFEPCSFVRLMRYRSAAVYMVFLFCSLWLLTRLTSLCRQF